MNSSEGARAAGPRSGVLPVDKPAGPTSHDVVSRTRRALGVRRVGHTGTLDPFASGLLLMCVGPATRLAEYLAGLPKTYRAVMRLGETTDTDDRTGDVLHRSEGWRDLGDAQIRDTLERQVGVIEQIPPLFSAKKIAGERLYVAARRGDRPERDPVAVTIHRIDILSLRLPDVEFEVECSAGTYVRAIARDVGEMLGVGGHLRALRRIRIGEHDVEAAIEIDRLDDSDRVRAAMLSPLTAVSHLPRLELEEPAVREIVHGRSLPAPVGLRPGRAPVALVTEAGELLAIAEIDDGFVRPRKVFA